MRPWLRTAGIEIDWRPPDVRGHCVVRDRLVQPDGDVSCRLRTSTA
ncbi:hypothetical protein [Burkholderia gladioli]|nr:hypothetical protein [Burkholderia gladioli]MDN7602220.1 hypothetical protein [Burkholderia gladioli]